jgi:hypothetical protein
MLFTEFPKAFLDPSIQLSLHWALYGQSCVEE